MKLPLRFWLPAVIFAVLVGFMAAGLRLDPKSVPSPLIGKPAPEFHVARLDDANRMIKRSDLLGQIWVLNVWASWCTSCREEHPTLMDFASKKIAAIYGLNYKDQRPDAQAWLAKEGDPYVASLFDAKGRIGIDFGVYGVPETFVIDKLGVIRFKHTGPLTPEIVRTRIEPLIKELQDAR